MLPHLACEQGFWNRYVPYQNWYDFFQCTSDAVRSASRAHQPMFTEVNECPLMDR
jgi:hypothetical protein